MSHVTPKSWKAWTWEKRGIFSQNHQIKLMTRQEILEVIGHTTAAVTATSHRQKAAQFNVSHFIFSRCSPISMHSFCMVSQKNYCSPEWTALECGEHTWHHGNVSSRFHSLTLLYYIVLLPLPDCCLNGCCSADSNAGIKCEMSSLICDRR